MQYLAKVEKASFLGNATLQLLAHKIDRYLWERLADDRQIEMETAIGFTEGALVLVTLDTDDATVKSIQDAVPWVLDLMDTFLVRGITPGFLEEEVERAEQWRQSLTLESQEVDRRALEAAARRDEIQELEKSLKLEQAELERREAELQEREAQLKSQEV
jgi:hypothetical protein